MDHRGYEMALGECQARLDIMREECDRLADENADLKETLSLRTAELAEALAQIVTLNDELRQMAHRHAQNSAQLRAENAELKKWWEHVVEIRDGHLVCLVTDDPCSALEEIDAWIKEVERE